MPRRLLTNNQIAWLRSHAYGKCKGTMFKKGRVPNNWKPVGSERIDGYTEIKIAVPNKWRLKHQWLWEKLHGSIPKGHKIVFLDQDKLNLDPDNLAMISSEELCRANQYGLIHKNKELTKSGLAVARLITALGKRKRRK